MSKHESISMEEVTELDPENRRARLVDGSEVPFSRITPVTKIATQREVTIYPIADDGGPRTPYAITVGIPNPHMANMIA